MNPVPWPAAFRGRVEWALAASLLVPVVLAATILPRVEPPQRTASEIVSAPAEPPTAAVLETPAPPAPRRASGSASLPDAAAPRSEPARPGAAPAEAPAAPTAPARLALALLDGATGAPVAGALVELARGEERALHRADERGVLALDLEPGPLCAVAWSSALTGGPLELELEAGAPARAELLLFEGVAVEGRVVDARTGTPVAGARVSFWTHAEQDVALTGADGSFRHPRFPARDPAQQVRVEAEGYAPAVRYLELLDGGGWAHRAAHAGERDALGEAGTPFVRVALSPALALSGRVLDPGGRPVAGARVAARGYARLLPDVASRDEGEAETDALGRFLIGGLRGDVSHALVVRATGCAELVRELPVRADQASGDLGDLYLAPAALLAGAVLDPAGEPAAGARVCLRRLDLAAPSPTTPADPGARPDVGRTFTRADPAGLFLFEGLAAGRYELSVRRDRGVIASLELELAPAEQRDDVALALDPATWTLRGEVVGPDGPLAGASVLVERFGAVAELTTDARGAFRLAGLDDAATYTVRARAAGCAPAEALVYAWERPVLRLARAPALAAATGGR